VTVRANGRIVFRFQGNDAFGSTPQTWLQMQLAYDLAAARKDESKIKVRRQDLVELHAAGMTFGQQGSHPTDERRFS
jgi:plasmid maintenance system antidote protein VapI